LAFWIPVQKLIKKTVARKARVYNELRFLNGGGQRDGIRLEVLNSSTAAQSHRDYTATSALRASVEFADLRALLGASSVSLCRGVGIGVAHDRAVHAPALTRPQLSTEAVHKAVGLLCLARTNPVPANACAACSTNRRQTL
jgi:hypothetical protein